MSHIDFKALFTKLDAFIVLHSAFSTALALVRRAVETAQRYSDAEVAVLLGESRAGKTRVLEIVEAESPPRRTADGLIMPILRVKIPRKPTTKSVVTQMLHRLGDPLFERGTETTKLIRLIGLLRKLNVRVIMLDEFQHFVSDRGTVNFEVADLFKVILDEAHVNLVFAGLQDAKAVIDANEQLAGRSLRPVYLSRLSWSRSADRMALIKIVVAFAKTLAPLRFPDFDGDEWGYRWYCASGGLIGYIAKIFRYVISDAAHEGRDEIRMEHLDAAYVASIYLIESNPLRPFDHAFPASPTPETMALALAVGRRTVIESAEPVRTTKRRRGGTTGDGRV